MSIDRVWLLIYDGGGRPTVWDVFSDEKSAFNMAKDLNSVNKEKDVEPFYVEGHRVKTDMYNF